MTKRYVRVVADLHCSWEGLPPTYRVFVNDELFSERTWIWTNNYLEENLQISAEPGEYKIRFELVPPYLAQLWAKDLRVSVGTASITNNETLRIYHDEG
jgi:hypothetical protein